MRIRMLELVDGARQASGLTVIIDVFRAFSTASYVMARGAHEILPVGIVKEAFEWKQRFPDAVLIGERGGQKVDGFDYGNSPKEVSEVDFTGKLVIQTTGAGTQGVIHAGRADLIIGGSFPMSEAMVRYIRARQPKEVSLVAMGTRGQVRSEEDALFASWLKGRLQGEAVPSQKEVYEMLRNARSAQKFFDPVKDWAPQEDFDSCLTMDQFPFVLELRMSERLKGKSFQKVRV